MKMHVHTRALEASLERIHESFSRVCVCVCCWEDWMLIGSQRAERRWRQISANTSRMSHDSVLKRMVKSDDF